MTEQQIKRIQEAMNTPGTAIQCETEKEARMLSEALFNISNTSRSA